jgi:hypothetical protein
VPLQDVPTSVSLAGGLAGYTERTCDGRPAEVALEAIDLGINVPFEDGPSIDEAS